MNKTTLYNQHAALGATFTDFGGWEMPVRYGSDLAEHEAVRNSAGLFDISHMGEIVVVGAQAADFLDNKLINLASKITSGRAKYSMLLNESGGIIDDLIVYRLSEEEVLIVANASNKDAVSADLVPTGFDCIVEDQSDKWSMIALQGPKSLEVLDRFVSEPITIGYYSIGRYILGESEVLIARTGYTGEDGFEIYCQNDQAESIWETVLNNPEVTPCGLASRDSLRLEAGMPLYGHELDDNTQPSEAGLGRAVVDREAFQGKSGLREPTKKLIGLKGEGKRAARQGYAVMEDNQQVGEVTSGILSPTLGYPIAMAFTTNLETKPGDKLMVDIRGNNQEFIVVELPFYKRVN
ncbi:MAG: glycine cleavage system aminomethyltransferase GcvT [Microbacteriaceae bacterium]|nr:glycine cleavage system aminomethyltransferase GcvT [Microbacteriaceae bacterium]